MYGCYVRDHMGGAAEPTDDPTLTTCADCDKRVPLVLEDESTRLPGHTGEWADCPDCGITGVAA